MLESPPMLRPRVPSSTPVPGDLTVAEREVLEFFVHLGKYLALPRSVGEIYGFLFATGDKHTLDDLVARLGISKGSASQGLRMLRGVGGVKVSHFSGDRKDYYEAELELPRILRNLVRDQLAVRLERAQETLAHLRQMVDDPRNTAPEGLAARVERLQAWQNKAQRLVPLVSTFLKM